MIKKITIKETGTFDKTGVVIDNLRRVNIIYGSNGVGKTTTSKVLEYAYAPKGHVLLTGETIVKPWKYPKCEVVWEGKPVQVLVYNKDFREHNLMAQMSGLATLENKPVIKLKGIEAMLKLPNSDLKKVESEIKRTEKELQDRLWEEVYEPGKDWKKLLKGYNRKAVFAKRICEIVKEKHNGDLFWNSTQMYGKIDANNVWHYLMSKSEAIVEKAETELACLREAAKECERMSEEWEKYETEPNIMSNYSTQNMSAPNYEAINRILKSNRYTGFSIQPMPYNSRVFKIQRENGNYVKDTLSEGESMVVSFLLFLQLLECDRKCGKKVVVIDDPIGSLDYAAIELVSSLTNELIKKARTGEGGIEQVFVLTHNASYQKSLNVNMPRNNTHYWKLTKKKGVSRLTAFEKVNPVRGDYHELWSLLREGSDSRITLPMIMRRIIEIYFLEYGRFDYDTMMSLIEGFKESRSGEDGREWYMKKFRKVFETMGHLDHYNMMMREE
jgi:wobble nucleotide-excising tRNase